jgi:hypothetical protein
MKLRVWFVRLWPLALIVPIGLVLWANRAPDAVRVTQVSCTTLATGCTVHIDGREIQFGMMGETKPLAPFQIWVKAAGLRKAEARFTMEGMDMGFNLYTLRVDQQGVFRANVTLPVCVSGRREWRMILDVDKTQLAVPFVTDL